MNKDLFSLRYMTLCMNKFCNDIYSERLFIMNEWNFLWKEICMIMRWRKRLPLIEMYVQIPPRDQGNNPDSHFTNHCDPGVRYIAPAPGVLGRGVTWSLKINRPVCNRANSWSAKNRWPDSRRTHSCQNVLWVERKWQILSRHEILVAHGFFPPT